MTDPALDIDVRNHSGLTLAVEWEWDVPEGFQMIGPAMADKAPRLIITLTRMPETDS